MKKVFFAFVAVSAIVLSACNNTKTEETTVAVDSTVVAEPAVEATAPADTTVVVDTTAAAAPAAH